LFAHNQTRLYGQANPTLTETISGFVNGETLATSGVTGSASAVGATSATVNTAVGQAVITASTTGLGAGNYDFAVSTTDGTLTINKAHLTVAADNQTRLYGQANPTLTETISGFVNGETLATSGVTGSASAVGATSATVNTAVGQAVITASTTGLGAGNYDFAVSTTDGTLTINKAHLTVAADNQTRLYGQANPTLTETISGFVNGETLATSGVTGADAARGASTATQTTPVGTAKIAPSLTGLGASNYDFATSSVDGTLTISAAPITPTTITSASSGSDAASNLAARVPADPVNPTTPGGPAALGGLPAPAPTLASASTGTETGSASSNSAFSTEANSAGSAGGTSNNGISVNLAQTPTAIGNGLVAVTVPKDTATSGAGFSFALPTKVVQSAAGATIEVTTISGEPLPAWLKFVPESNSFVATAVPEGGFPFQVLVTSGGRRTVVVVSERKE
jgi:hypothetical protein